MSYLRTRRGFTLLELIVVIVILGLLAALAIPTFAKVIAKSKDSVTEQTLSAIARDAQALHAFNPDAPWSDSSIETAITETSAAAMSGSWAAGQLEPVKDTNADATTPGENQVVYAVDNTSSVIGLAMRSGENVCALAADTTSILAFGCVTSDDPAALDPAQTVVENPEDITTGGTESGGGGIELPGASAPMPPVNVTADVSGTSITVSWEAPLSDGGSPVTGYQVGLDPVGLGDTTTDLSYTFTDLASGSYTVSVTALNAVGASLGVAVDSLSISTPLVASYPDVAFTYGQSGQQFTPTVTGGTGNYTFTSTYLPTGVSLDPATGTLTGPSVWGKTVVQVDAGYDHALAVTADGKLYAWGEGQNYALGTGSTFDVFSPVQVNGILAGKFIVEVSTSRYFTLALDSDGYVYAWGNNDSGQLGNNSTSYSSTPIKVTSLSNIKHISAGYKSSYAVTNAGQLYSWGENGAGELGRAGTSAPVKTPALNPFVTGVDRVESEGQYALALTTAGDVYSWGKDWEGETGYGSTGVHATPTKITFSGSVVDIAAGSRTSAAVTSGGALYMWGDNAYKQLGQGNNTTDRSTPTLVNGGDLAGKQVAKVAVYSAATVAVGTDGAVYGWGTPLAGETGVGTQNTPKVSASLSGVADVAAGSGVSYWLAGNGKLYAAGMSDVGQSGTGAYLNVTSPTALSTFDGSGDLPTTIVVNVSDGVTQKSVPVPLKLAR